MYAELWTGIFSFVTALLTLHTYSPTQTSHLNRTNECKNFGNLFQFSCGPPTTGYCCFTERTIFINIYAHIAFCKSAGIFGFGLIVIVERKCCAAAVISMQNAEHFRNMCQSLSKLIFSLFDMRMIFFFFLVSAFQSFAIILWRSILSFEFSNDFIFNFPLLDDQSFPNEKTVLQLHQQNRCNFFFLCDSDNCIVLMKEKRKANEPETVVLRSAILD